MIIPEEHMLQSELNNLASFLLAWAYPLRLIIKNTKIFSPLNAITCYSNNRKKETRKSILPIVIPLSDIVKLFTATIRKNCHTIANNTTFSAICKSKPSSSYTKSNNIPNHLAHSAQTCGFSQQNS